VVTCIQKEVDPMSVHHASVWRVASVIFTFLFAAELVVNLYGRWWREFWSCNWNRFDFIVVVFGILDLALKDLPAPLRLIKLLRAFRIFRLISHRESLGQVLRSLFHAVPGVINAFAITIIFLCIYAVVAIDIFSDIYTDCHQEDFEGPAAMKTARDKCWGYDYYGSFTRSIYSMFQVLTGDSWSEAGARPALNLLLDENSALLAVITYTFFYSFIIINCFVFLNILVAVLLEGMNKGNASVHEDDEPGEDEHPDIKVPDLIQAIAGMQADLVAQTSRAEKALEDIKAMKQFVRLRFKRPREYRMYI